AVGEKLTEAQVVAAMATVAALWPGRGPEANPIYGEVSGLPADNPAAPESLEPPDEAAAGWLYLIREYEGRVAVFTREDENPVTVLEKWVRHLPEYDRIQMQEGIEVYSDEELAARIEDFTS
ncbi:MAG: hypothetical protein LBU86_04185, partial [Oscillospiraceae bacterium]|nr:hypothetical protein [Oscillospiraceae bacterium]